MFLDLQPKYEKMYSTRLYKKYRDGGGNDV